MTPEEAFVSLEAKFASGNDVPVTLARITREEFDAIRQAIAEEREACADIADGLAQELWLHDNAYGAGTRIAEAIRSRT